MGWVLGRGTGEEGAGSAGGSQVGPASPTLTPRQGEGQPAAGAGAAIATQHPPGGVLEGQLREGSGPPAPPTPTPAPENTKGNQRRDI